MRYLLRIAIILALITLMAYRLPLGDYLLAGLLLVGLLAMVCPEAPGHPCDGTTHPTVKPTPRRLFWQAWDGMGDFVFTCEYCSKTFREQTEVDARLSQTIHRFVDHTDLGAKS